MFRYCFKRFCKLNAINQHSFTQQIVQINQRNQLLFSNSVSQNIRLFQTTQCQQTPKLLVLFIRPFVSIISGRLFRRWWQNRNPEQKQKYLNLFKRYKLRILSAVGSYFSVVIFYYFYNVEDTPFTNRKRFMVFSADHLINVNKEVAEAMIGDLPALDAKHPCVKRVVSAAQRIVRSNSDIEQFKDVNWRVSVLDQTGLANALVTGDGQIIIFKEMIEKCATDDELAIILSHEMAHAILNHVGEKISNTWLIGFFTGPLLFLIWALTPSSLLAALFTFLQDTMTKIVIEYPYSRSIETEADKVGLRLAAKACIDVRQAVSFWKRMNDSDKTNVHPIVIKYLTTHPTHTERWMTLEKQLESALMLRSKCNCKPLGPLPPELAKNIIVEQERNHAIHIRII